MAALVLWVSLGWVEGCKPLQTDGPTAHTEDRLRTTDEGLRLAEAGLGPTDGWEPGPPEAWQKCRHFIGSGPHDGVNGPKLTGLELLRGHGLSKEGASIENVRIEQDTLVGEVLSPGGEKTPLRGDGWRGAQFRGRVPCPFNSAAKKLNVYARIRDVIPERDGARAAGNAWRYKVEILWPPVGPTRRTSNKSEIRRRPVETAPSWKSDYTSEDAVALEGIWDDSTGAHQSSADLLTIAGDDTAVGNCYHHFRYRPWNASDPASSKPMVELHAACVRMVRADYCGDGKSATRKGTPIAVWDTANGSADGPNKPGHGFEAAWTSKGAVCRDHLRWPVEAESCTSALPSCHSPDEAKKIASQNGLGELLLFNASCKGHPCPDDPSEKQP